MELGYHVTPVRNATAAFTHDMMHAAHDLNGPTYATGTPQWQWFCGLCLGVSPLAATNGL